MSPMTIVCSTLLICPFPTWPIGIWSTPGVLYQKCRISDYNSVVYYPKKL